MVRAYQELENRRVDERVEADLGLRFYVEGFGREDRTFDYFVGPTNSGKTYAAIELLREAESGVYLAPLRLLALEVFERLKDLGVAASLVTGEERVTDSAARHVSSTVEWSISGARSTSRSSTKRRCCKTSNAAGRGRSRSRACARSAS